ncbi:MAG: hypothetical protein D6768_16590 [Chloroflexi bacterium]|nr:MAG: hypothetical protein D6768_16590 [Chloroflexota bacterium]
MSNYVVFLQRRQLGGNPKSISAWVYGDGSGHFLNVWLKDAGGETWQMNFGRVDFTGWREMIAPIAADRPWPSGYISGPKNGQIEYPISFEGIVLDDGVDTFIGNGTIYIDNLTSRAEADTPTPQPATPTTAPVVNVTPTFTPVPGLYRLAVGSQHRYETWGAPAGADICDSYNNNNFNDKIHMKGFNIEILLTNRSSVAVSDDWADFAEFVTSQGRTVQACYYGYPGAGPQPGATSSMTFFTIVESDEFVRIFKLDIGGQTLQLCLDPGGAQSPC